jgi:protein gp37
MAALCDSMEWPMNVWAGTTVESSARYHRLSSLLKIPAAVRFISFEPLLGAVDDVDLRGIHWAAVGGESGPDARPMKADWVRAIRDRCIREGVAFYFKQWGGVHHSSGGRTLDGRIWDQMPDPSGQLTLDF